MAEGEDRPKKIGAMPSKFCNSTMHYNLRNKRNRKRSYEQTNKEIKKETNKQTERQRKKEAKKERIIEFNRIRQN
jgi:hypothetical protein